MKGYVLRGVLFVVPALVTLAILLFVLGFISGFLGPLALFVEEVTGVGGVYAGFREMSVGHAEEGLQAIITSGVTVSDPEGTADERLPRRLEDV